MTGADLIRKVRRLGRAEGVPVRFEEIHGKGSHGRLYYGASFTTVQDRRHELPKGTLHAMCRQLGISPRDLEGR